MIHDLLPIILTTLLLFILLSGILILNAYAERSPQRNVLIGTLSIWIPVISLVLYRLTKIYPDAITGYLSHGMAFWGMICFMSCLGYGASVLFYKRFTFKQILIFISPAIVACIASNVINQIAGVPFTHAYPNWEAWMADFGSAVSIIRITMLVIILMYMLFLIYTTLKLIPIFNNYLQNHESDERYNLHWLYSYIVMMCSVSVVYFTLSVVTNYQTQVAYMVVASLSFIILIDTGRSYRCFPHLDKIKIEWRWADGWVSVDKVGGERRWSKKMTDNYIAQIKSWIIETKQYADINFSMSDITAQYPDLETTVLIEIFHQKHTTFQTFVRDIRIHEAVKIFNESENNMRYKEICFMVGFSHYSSFSRAFTSVMGTSPSKYLS